MMIQLNISHDKASLSDRESTELYFQKMVENDSASILGRAK